MMLHLQFHGHWPFAGHRRNRSELEYPVSPTIRQHLAARWRDLAGQATSLYRVRAGACADTVPQGFRFTVEQVQLSNVPF